MMRRAPLPLLRQSKALVFSPARPITQLWSPRRRWYSRDKRTKLPPGGYVPPAAAPPSRFAQLRQTSQPYDRSPRPEKLNQSESSPEFSEAQDELHTSPSSQENTPPSSTGAGIGAGMSEAGTRLPRGSQDFLGEQNGFNASIDSNAENNLKDPQIDASKAAQISQASTDSSSRPTEPIPDLTQGIPSTLDTELGQAGSKATENESLKLTEDPSQSSTSSGGKRRSRGDFPQSPYVSSLERKSNRIANTVYAIIAAGFLGGAVLLGRNWDSTKEERRHPDAPNGWGFGSFYNRVFARMSDLLGYYRDPAFEKLLPDEDPDPTFRAPFTLVLGLDDLLMHSEWSRKEGWRIAKRPGLDYFIRYLSQYYEIVLWTSQPSMNADPVIRKLDPYRIMRFPLFREATLYKKGEYIKDLSYLNRDLAKVLIIDTEPSHTKHQPENAIILPKWQGDPQDQTLIALLPFLEYVATMGFDDTRKVLKSFEGTYIPEEFHKREKLLREKFQAEEKAKAGGKRGGGLSLGSLFSARPRASGSGMDESLSQGTGEGKMIWDQIRERGQKQYQAIDKEIRENGDKFLAELSAEEKRYQEESMNSMKSGFVGWFGFGRDGKN